MRVAFCQLNYIPASCTGGIRTLITMPCSCRTGAPRLRACRKTRTCISHLLRVQPLPFGLDRRARPESRTRNIHLLRVTPLPIGPDGLVRSPVWVWSTGLSSEQDIRPRDVREDARAIPIGRTPNSGGALGHLIFGACSCMQRAEATTGVRKGGVNRTPDTRFWRPLLYH